MHLNTQSLLPKIDELQLLVEDKLPDFLCITESWLSSQIPNGLVDIEDYVLCRLDRESQRRGGGLVCYFKKRLLRTQIL